MSKSKEEILDIHLTTDFNCLDDRDIDDLRGSISQAMDEYAKQQSIAFAKHYAHGFDDKWEVRYEWWLKHGSALGV